MTQDTTLESDKTQENITYKRAKRLLLSQQVTTRLQRTDKTACQTQNINNKKDLQKKHHLGTVSKKYFLLEGLNQFYGTSITLIFDVDQEKQIFGLHERFLTYRYILSRYIQIEI